MGSVDSSPYISRSKCIDPVTGAALITAGSNLLGDILGFGSQSSANNTNLQIARETNAQNYKMFQEQLAYNEDMWNKQNEYNDPKNQAQRLLAAGINPATVFGNGAITPAGQLVAPQAPQMEGAHVNPYNFDLSGIGQAASAFFQNQLLGKEAESKGLDNQAKQIDLQFKVSRILLDMKEQVTRINKQLADTSVSKQQKEMLVTQRRDLENHIKLFEENYDYLSQREKLQNDVMQNQSANLVADSTLKRAQATYQQLLSAYYPAMATAEINQLTASFYDLCQSAQLKAKQGELTSAQAISQYIENGIKAYQYSKTKSKQEIRDSSRIVRGMTGAIDMIGETIFGNIKLFGK